MAQQVDPKQALRLLPQEYASVVVEEVSDTRTPEQIAEDDATRMQAQAEGVDLIKDGKDLAKRVALGKEKDRKEFRIADAVGLMPLMEFAYHANSGLDTSDMGAMAAIYEMLHDCISEDADPHRTENLNSDGTLKKGAQTEWDRFRAHAKHIKAGAEELMEVVQQTVELLTARPTSQESGSLRPSPRTSDSLMDTSSGQREMLVPVGDLGKVSSA